MDLNKENLRKIRGLILFTLLVVAVMVNYTALFSLARVGLNVLFPFILGGGIAFLLNAPTHFFEKHLFQNRWMKNRAFSRRMARPVSLVLSILFVIGLIFLVIFVVVPSLGKTVVGLGTTISSFFAQMQRELEKLFRDNTPIAGLLEDFDLDWQKIIDSAVAFVKTGATNVLSSTYGIVRSVVSAVSNFFIGFVFACYLILQKEKLKGQITKVGMAILPDKVWMSIDKVAKLTYRTFSSFLTGQCVEAVILGTMFFVVMTVLRFPYAVLVGVLIAFTALIPIFGAFIGCFVGAFLILMVSPIKALGFLVLFLVLQQIEGNFIYPHVVGNSVGLPSIWVLMAVTLGGSLMGIVGMLIFIPLTSVCYTLFREFIYRRLEKKGKKV